MLSMSYVEYLCRQDRFVPESRVEQCDQIEARQIVNNLIRNIDQRAAGAQLDFADNGMSDFDAPLTEDEIIAMRQKRYVRKAFSGGSNMANYSKEKRDRYPKKTTTASVSGE